MKTTSTRGGTAITPSPRPRQVQVHFTLSRHHDLAALHPLAQPPRRRDSGQQRWRRFRKPCSIDRPYSHSSRGTRIRRLLLAVQYNRPPEVVAMLTASWEKAFTSKHITSAFARCGWGDTLDESKKLQEACIQCEYYSYVLHGNTTAVVCVCTSTSFSKI